MVRIASTDIPMDEERRFRSTRDMTSRQPSFGRSRAISVSLSKNCLDVNDSGQSIGPVNQKARV